MKEYGLAPKSFPADLELKFAGVWVHLKTKPPITRQDAAKYCAWIWATVAHVGRIERAKVTVLTSKKVKTVTLE